MRTFLLDLHGALAGFGPAAPLLYPLRETGELQLLGHSAAGGGAAGGAARDLGELADAVRIELVREYSPRWLALFLVDLAAGAEGGLAGQLEEIGERFLAPLAARGLPPTQVLVVTVDALAREPHTGAPHEPAARERWQGDVARLTTDPAAALRGLTVIRFPLRRTPEPLFHQDLIHLVYLLLALIEVQRGEDSLPRGQLFQAQEVALDSGEVTRWMDEYIGCLQDAERAVAHRLEHPEAAILQLVRDPRCACGQALPVMELEAQSFGWFLQLDDLRRWDGWGQRTGAALGAREREGEEMLHHCREERRRRAFEPVAETVPSLETEAARLGEQLHRARRELLQASSAPEDAWNWEEEMRRQMPGAYATLEARPRPRAFAIFLAALLLLVLLPALLLLPGDGLPRLLPSAALLIGGSLAATALAMRRLRAGLANATDFALKSARRTAARMGERVERQRRHLELLCAAEAARHNEVQASAALADRGREVLLLKHHRAALQHHLHLARALRGLHAADLPPRPSPSAPPEESARLSTRGWPLDLPPHRHPLYAPARCTGTRAETTHDLRIGARQLQWTSTLTHGLRQVRLVEDPIYEQDPPSPAPPEERGARSEERGS